MALRKFCDHCKAEITDYKNEVKITINLTKNFYFHKDCFNRKFSTDIKKLESEE